jgi:hypothetical protein
LKVSDCVPPFDDKRKENKKEEQYIRRSRRLNIKGDLPFINVPFSVAAYKKDLWEAEILSRWRII